jgi:hypothetical protein
MPLRRRPAIGDEPQGAGFHCFENVCTSQFRFFTRMSMLKMYLLILGATLFAGCRQPCDASNCLGCCTNDVCYLDCKNGGIGGGGAGGGSPVSCGDNFSQCTISKPCCATEPRSGDPLTCLSGRCGVACKTGSQPCSSNTECCSSPKSTSGYYCNIGSNSCSSCANRGNSCVIYSANNTSCCPGLTCGSKPATPNFKECL